MWESLHSELKFYSSLENSSWRETFKCNLVLCVPLVQVSRPSPSWPDYPNPAVPPALPRLCSSQSSPLTATHTVSVSSSELALFLLPQMPSPHLFPFLWSYLALRLFEAYHFDSAFLTTASFVCFLKDSLIIIFLKKFLAVPCGMWDLSSLTRDRTHAPCIGRAES